MSIPTLPLEIKLENQMKKRINENELSKNDLEFYQRKIRRIQNQLQISNDELAKVRVKLKRAEDFEMKYDLLFKQMTDLKADNDSNTKQIITLLTLNDQLKLTLQQKSSKIHDFSIQRENLFEQVSTWKQRFQRLHQKSKQELEDERVRSQHTIKLQQTKIRSEFKERQQDMQYQIHQLKKAIQQKQMVEQIINQRVEKVRQEKEDEIQRLKRILEQRKQSFEKYMREKDQQLQRMKDKFQKMINFDIENLKSNQEDQEEIFGLELNGLREMIALKNDEIDKLFLEIDRISKEHQTNRKELLEEISLLKEKVYVVEKESDIQLQNLKDRLIALHAQDAKAVEDRYQRMIDTLKEDLQNARKYNKQLERIQQATKRDYQRSKSEFHDKLRQNQNRIRELMMSLKQRGDLNASQLKSLHESFHLITSQKQIMATEYESNLTFLTQQVTKLNNMNEIKTKEITKLHEEIHTLKVAYEDRIVECESRYRKQRKEREEERQKLRVQRERLNQKIEDQEREFKNELRKLQRENQKLQKQKQKAEYMFEESQKDIQRLNKYIKQLDDSLKNEFKKNQMSTLDKDSLRRQVLAQLQRQKVQLQAMKLMQVDQLRRKYEMENARLTTINEQLKTQVLNKSIDYEKLENEFKKLDYQHRNADKLQRDKIKQYEQKMITLSQQINITQDLYKVFLQAKSKAEK